MRIKKYLLDSFLVARVSRDHEAKMDRERCKSIVGGIQGNGAAGGMGRRETAVDESRKEAADRVRQWSIVLSNYVVR